MVFRSAPSPAALGKMGERRAAWFYRLRGYRIVERNYRSSDGELDLVVRRGRMLVFVEVKARWSAERGQPHEAVDAGKRKRLVRQAERYIASHRVGDCEIRFDVVALTWNGWYFDLEHFPDAFHPVAQAGRPWRWE